VQHQPSHFRSISTRCAMMRGLTLKSCGTPTSLYAGSTSPDWYTTTCAHATSARSPAPPSHASVTPSPSSPHKSSGPDYRSLRDERRIIFTIFLCHVTGSRPSAHYKDGRHSSHCDIRYERPGTTQLSHRSIAPPSIVAADLFAKFFRTVLS
jgi:hypothetical protein